MGEIILYPPPGLPPAMPANGHMVPNGAQSFGPQAPCDGQAYGPTYGPHLEATFVQQNVQNNMHAQVEANLQQNLFVGVDPNEVMHFAASAAAAVSAAQNDAADAINTA